MGSGTGHVVGLWDGLFNPENYTNGSVCFTHDDHLVELLNAAKADASAENMKAFNDYIRDNAIGKGLYSFSKIVVAQDGVTELPMANPTLPLYGPCTITDDYVSVVGN